MVFRKTLIELLFIVTQNTKITEIQKIIELKIMENIYRNNTQ